MANVCVFNDLKLGGVLREYVGVIKRYDFGEVEEFEPTNIVHIESDDSPGVRYELVDRKAEVGERVIIISEGSGWYEGKNGEVFEVIDGKERGFSGEETFVETNANRRHALSFIEPKDYRVLVPADSEQTSPKSNDDIIANLVARVADLERKQAELERRDESQRRLNGVVSQRIAELAQRINGTHRDVETWAQDHENLAFKVVEIEQEIGKLKDEVETLRYANEELYSRLGHVEKDVDDMGIKQVNPQTITLDVEALAKLIGGAR